MRRSFRLSSIVLIRYKLKFRINSTFYRDDYPNNDEQGVLSKRESKYFANTSSHFIFRRITPFINTHEFSIIERKKRNNKLPLIQTQRYKGGLQNKIQKNSQNKAFIGLKIGMLQSNNYYNPKSTVCNLPKNQLNQRYHSLL